MNQLEETNPLDAPIPCPCISWAREADDVMREHHPRCAEGNPVPHYVHILMVRDETTRHILLRQFVERHFPTAYNVLTKGGGDGGEEANGYPSFTDGGMPLG